jgi:hypothetical protein
MLFEKKRSTEADSCNEKITKAYSNNRIKIKIIIRKNTTLT